MRPPSTEAAAADAAVLAVEIQLRADLIRRGLNDRAIATMLRSGALVRLRHGAYADAAAYGALDAVGRHRLLVRAAYRQARVPVVVSHVSSVLEHGGPTWGMPMEEVDLTRLDRRSGRREAGVRQHSGVMDDEEVVDLHGLRVSRPARSAVEVCTVVGVGPSLAYANHLLHTKRTTPAEVRECYEGKEAWPHSLVTELVLRLADPRIESVGETRFSLLCFHSSLPAPVPQLEVVDPATGELVGRLDFAWPDLGVWLEFDGKVKYQGVLRPGESATDVVLREKRREDRIRELTGWRCIRITWADLESPQRLVARLRALLVAAA